MAGNALAISLGGTSQTTAPGARIALGLEIGVDVQPHDAGLDALAAFNTNGFIVQTANDTFAGRTLIAPAAGFTIANPAGTAGDPTFALANDLAALEAASGTGIVVRSGSDTYQRRELIPPAAGITVTNPKGIAGDITLVLANDLAALEALSGTNTIYYRSGVDTWSAVTIGTALTFSAGTLDTDSTLSALAAYNTNGFLTQTTADTFTGRTITGTANKITVTNGDGVSGNPTITIPDSPIIVTPVLTLQQSAGPTPTTEGDIQWDTDDNAIVIGDGASQKVFRANAWEIISIQSVSGVASVIFTDLSPYRHLRFSGWAQPATDGVSVGVRTSTNNGSSYDAGVNDYGLQYHRATNTTTTAAAASFDRMFFNAATLVGNNTQESISFFIDIFEFNKARFNKFVGQTFWQDAAGAYSSATITGERLQATARDAFNFTFTTGNIANGHFYLEGIRG